MNYETEKVLIDKILEKRDIYWQHHIESYNDLIKFYIPNILKNFSPISVRGNYDEDQMFFKHEVLFEFLHNSVFFQKPRYYQLDGSINLMTKNDARMKNLHYASEMYLDVNIKTRIYSKKDEYTEQCKTIKNHMFCKIPVMIKSMLCNDESSNDTDVGGYFILSGGEKVIITQERQAENKIFVFNSPSTNKYDITSEIKSIANDSFVPAKQFIIYSNFKRNSELNGINCLVKMNSMKSIFPVGILLKSLGCKNDREIFDNICQNQPYYYDKVTEILLKSSNYNQENAIEFLCNNIKYTHRFKKQEKYFDINDRIKHLKKYAFNYDLLPHLKTNAEKIYVICEMIRKTIKYAHNDIQEDDRDSFENKRCDSSGIMLANLFRQSFAKHVKDLQNIFMKEINNGSWKISENFHEILSNSLIHRSMKSNNIFTSMKYSLVTGNWGIKNNTVKIGVAQLFQRLSYLGTLSHLRRINTPVDKTTKMTKPRKLHQSLYGFICPSETPEGASCGIVKNMTLPCLISSYIDQDDIINVVKRYHNFSEDITGDIIFVNGVIVGSTDNMIQLRDFLQDMRRTGILNYQTSITPNYQNGNLNIYSGAGRLLRPLLISKDGKPKICELSLQKIKTMTLCELLLKGYIEYIDPQESSVSLIKSTKDKDTEDATHFEISNSLILGILASNIPFCNHNQSPRVTYQSAMGKQALSIYCKDFTARYDTIANLLWYPTKPVINTNNSKYTGSSELPSGSTIIVAIASDKGFNQEDSLIFNRASIDRGLFGSSFYRTYTVEEKTNQVSGKEETLKKPIPNDTIGLHMCSYDCIDQDGLPIVNKKIKGGDCILGKVVPIKNKKLDSDKKIYDKEFRDASIYSRQNEDGTIHSYYQGTNNEGYSFTKIKIRNSRIPEIGDKFASRHGQKGTIGMVYEASDMPYTREGVTPDVIMNPHAFPSRMTFGQIFEMIFGKYCVKNGCFGDGSPFTDMSIDDLIKKLKKSGIEYLGEEDMFSGEFGTKLSSKIFIAPCHYQKLKHMVSDKIHARSTGPIVNLTRQPVEGRSRQAGLRIGEMERDVLIAHGLSSMLKERFVDCSDGFEAHFNEKGEFAAYNKDKQILNTHNTGSKFNTAIIPYAFKLLSQELTSIGISINFKFDN